MSRGHRRVIQWALVAALGTFAAACDPDTPVDRNINTDAGAGFEVPPQEAGTDAADAGEDGDS